MIKKQDLYKWYSIPAEELESHSELVIRFRMARNSCEMGQVMIREFVDEIVRAGGEERQFRAVIPCKPKCWYAPFAEYINKDRIDMKHVTISHIDECLDRQGSLLAQDDPYSSRTFMLREFHGSIAPGLNIPEASRNFSTLKNIYEVEEKIAEASLDYTLGGWGQDGRIAYNQSRGHPFPHITIGELKESSTRIQESNLDTITTLGQGSYETTYQLIPSMSITLGVREYLSVKKVRLYSDTGSRRQTALRVVLSSEKDSECPMALLRDRRNVIITATYEAVNHPIPRHPEQKFTGVNI